MKLHNHVIIEPKRSRQSKHLWYPRWFFHLYRGPEYGQRTVLDGHIEFVLSKPTPEFGIDFEVGTRGSETPFDGYIKIAGTTLYWGIKQGGTLAENITQRWFTRTKMSRECLRDECDCPLEYPTGSVKKHPNGDNRYEGRQIKIYTFEGQLWWQIWTMKNSWKRGQFADWRSGSLRLNPLDHIWGSQRYWYENRGGPMRIWIDLPEMVYPVQIQLQKQYFGRPKRMQQRILSWSVDVDASESKGIPDSYDSSGGWKGDRVWAFSVPINRRGEDGPRHDWWVDAKAAIESRILKTRAETGFREPLPLDEEGPKNATDC